MRTYFSKLSVAFAIAILSLGFQSCDKKAQEEVEVVRIQDVVPQEIIDNLASKGMAINQGTNPPQLNMAIRVSPYELVSPWGPNDHWDRGQVIGDYYYKFYGQTSKQEISYDYHNASNSDKGTGNGSFIIGSGNKFTIFSEDIGELSSVPYKSVAIMSGELDGTTVKNFQYAFVIKEKTGDTNNSTMIPVNTGRLWKDGDLSSESTSSFRVVSSGEVKSGSIQAVK